MARTSLGARVSPLALTHLHLVDVIVVQLDTWGLDVEPAALARASLATRHEALALLVGAGAIDDELARQLTGRRWGRVRTPLYALSGRRFPDVRHSGDAPQLAWSLALLQALSELHARTPLASVEFPSLAALAYASLQERMLGAAFAGTRFVVRFDGLTAIELSRKGLNPDISQLLALDMERMCLEQCDVVRVDGAAVARSLQGFLQGRGPPLRFLTPQVRSVQPVQQGESAAPLVCIGSEAPTLRQSLRAIAGYLAATPEDQQPVAMICTAGLLNEVIGVVPTALRDRFVISGPELLQGAPMRVVLADRWTAGGAFARALLARGHCLMADAANPGLDPRHGWLDRVNVLLHAQGAAQLSPLLRSALKWRPETLAGHAGEVDAADAPGEKRAASGESPVETVTIIVPCFNMGRWLGATLANIGRFTWPALQIVIVDDGSSDDATLQLLDSLQAASPPSTAVVRLPFNQGLSAARNAGLDVAQGEFTLCLDADDLVSADFVALAVAALRRSPAHDFVVPRCAYFEGSVGAVDVSQIRAGRILPMVGAAFDSGVFGNHFSTATCLARTAVLQALRYDETLRSYEDWELYRRALHHGHRFIVSNDVHFYYRRRADSMVHAPQMRAQHSRLYAEMGAASSLSHQPLQTSAIVSCTLAAPACLEGSSAGVLMSRVTDTLGELDLIRRSRLVGFAYRISRSLRGFILAFRDFLRRHAGRN